jgi:hypothetical protein
LETDREVDRAKKVEASDLWIECSLRRGVEGDDFAETLAGMLAVLLLGEGVRGILPPAVFVEKMP